MEKWLPNQPGVVPSQDATSRVQTVLLTVSTAINEAAKAEIARGERPHIDYLALADAMSAELLDYTKARSQSGWFGRLLERLGGSNVLLAWIAFRQRAAYQVIITDGEHVGLPFALFCRLGLVGQRNASPCHLMITHVLSVRKKLLLVECFRLQRYITQFIVYASYQEQFLQTRWALSAERIVRIPFMVDSEFFSPTQVTRQATPGATARAKRLIASAGREFRDYATLIQAVTGVEVELIIATGSPFSQRRDLTEAIEKPANVKTGRFSYEELRQLYADSLFIVVPLFDVDFQAGITLVLEAMAMGKAVICSAVPGQTDAVIEGETGLYVPPQDPIKLREAIEYLLANPDIAARMGEHGRRRVEAAMTLARYTDRFNALVNSAQAAATRR